MKWCSEVPLTQFMEATVAAEEKPNRKIAKRPAGVMKKPAVAPTTKGIIPADAASILDPEVKIAVKMEKAKRKANKDLNVSKHYAHSRMYGHFKRIVKSNSLEPKLTAIYATKAFQLLSAGA